MPNLLCLASWNADLISHVARPVERGETVLASAFEILPGGKGSNAAIAAARQGARVALLARVGDDEFGRMAIDLWHRERIDVRGVEVAKGERSGVAQIQVFDDGDNSIAVYRGAGTGLAAAHAERARAVIAACKLVMASNEVPTDCTAAAFQIARAAGVATLLNPAPAQPIDDDLLALIDVLTPNEGELLALAEMDDDDVDHVTGTSSSGSANSNNARLGAAAHTLLARGVGAVVVTLGAAGCRVYLRQQAPVDLAGYAVKVTDTIGAGDTFTGALAAGLVAGLPLLKAVRRANAAAAMSVRGHGAIAAMPTLRELDAWMVEHAD
jgi:ribokinase